MVSTWAPLRKFLPFLGLVSALVSPSIGSDGVNVVDTGYARYRGNLTYPDTVAYLGVPYAEPPVGDLRFRAPLPLNTSRVAHETSGRVVDVTEYPNFCIQGTTGSGDAGGAGSEDCLKLNVYAPAGAKKGDNLPVLVYIHGGGYVYGNPANWPFDHWVHQSPNVVIASVYYRLNSFGFLTAPEMAHDASLGALNAGFKDQSMALRWVRQHIAAFGGDPAQVTINGESAGGSSVELHLVAREPPLFKQAIAQSVYRTPLPEAEQQRDMFNFYAEQAGCGAGAVQQKMACLRVADVSALSRAQDAVDYNFTGPYNAFHPVIDNDLFVESPSIAIQNGRFARVPVIVGSCANETLSSGTDITAALKSYFPQLTSADLDDLAALYPLSDFDSASQQFQVATGESDVICGREIIGLAAARASKAYTYRYSQPVPPAHTNITWHAAENWMMFRGTSTGFNGTTTFEPQSATDEAFAAELIAYWLSFVRAGDPNTHKLPGAPVWPAYEAGAPGTRWRVTLQEPGEGAEAGVSGSAAEIEPALEARRCAVVASKAQNQQA